MPSEEALPSSKLGTRQHWDDVYTREVQNFDELGDEGEIWFGEDAVQRMVDFLERIAEGDIKDLADEESGNGEERLQIPEEPRVLDVGTGNGHLLFALLELDVQLTPASKMLGIDYSAPSVDLCRRIGKARGAEAERVGFEDVDFLTQSSTLRNHRIATDGQGWDIVCDKGTLDAIALSAKDSASDDDPVAQYVKSVSAITHSGSLFLITSCNFTEAELVRRFEDDFSVFHVVPVPSFSFGGQKGSTTVTIAFSRR